MRVIRTLGLLLALAMIFHAATRADAASLEAWGAILMNLKSGSVLYVQSEDVQVAPASLAKIMTLHLAMDAIKDGRISLSDDVKVSRRASIQPGARMNLRNGDVVPLDDLLIGTAVASGNDAAVAVAEHVAGSVDAFNKLMNDKAGELGMSRTVFRNPNGLPSKGQVTTAKDMLALSKSYIETHPDALRYHSIPQITYRGKTTTNKNPLLRMTPGVDGLKTGWTSASRHNLIATASSGDVRLVSVVLGAPTSGDLASGSSFLIEAGFRTVASGGAVKVIHQLEAIEAGVSLDVLMASGAPAGAVPEAASTPPGPVAPEPEPESAPEPAEYGPGLYGPEYDPEIDPGDDTEFDDYEFDDPSVWTEAERAPGDGAGAALKEGGLSVREIEVGQVIEAVEQLCIDANYLINDDIKKALQDGLESEEDEVSRDILGQLLENARIASEGELPLCQDTGMAMVFVELGQDVRITGGSIRDAINEGVRLGYKEGYLRASVVADPVDRVNTGDNTPAVIHFDVVPGDKLKITLAPKGFGSENMSRIAMLTPASGIAGVREFVIDAVKAAGPNPCPPIIVGVGVGGTADYAALLAKRAMLRPIGTTNGSWLWRGLEGELLEAINSLGIGPAGLGGKTTALAVHIETFPTHIAGLPVAVSIGCHSTRHVEITL
ncbi:MAG: fumarate hydratase [Synergistaceae bacterium]|jgi:fumarate hydratase subunit alpha|nr:fumarate hydratase [Synergistaceae bacterium]